MKQHTFVVLSLAAYALLPASAQSPWCEETPPVKGGNPWTGAPADENGYSQNAQYQVSPAAIAAEINRIDVQINIYQGQLERAQRDLSWAQQHAARSAERGIGTISSSMMANSYLQRVQQLQGFIQQLMYRRAQLVSLLQQL